MSPVAFRAANATSPECGVTRVVEANPYDDQRTTTYLEEHLEVLLSAERLSPAVQRPRNLEERAVRRARLCVDFACRRAGPEETERAVRHALLDEQLDPEVRLDEVLRHRVVLVHGDATDAGAGRSERARLPDRVGEDVEHVVPFEPPAPAPVPKRKVRLEHLPRLLEARHHRERLEDVRRAGKPVRLAAVGVGRGHLF